MRTEKEILDKINELSSNEDNFVSVGFDGENETYVERFSSWSTEETLKKFANWLLEKE